MPGAIIVANQPGAAGAGTPGVGRNDLWQGAQVNLSVATSGNTSYQWELLGKPPGSAVALATPTDPTSAFTPDLVGTYRIRLTTNGGGAGNVQTLVFRVRFNSSGALANRGWAFPAYGELGPEANYGGNTRGWAEPIETILTDIRLNFGGGGGGGGVTSLASLTGDLTFANGGGVSASGSSTQITLSLAFGGDAAGDIPVRGALAYQRLPIGSNGQVLTVSGGTAVWASPASAGVASVGGAVGALTFGTSGNVVGSAAGTALNFAITIAGQAHGDLLFRNGTTWTRLPAGTGGQFLMTTDVNSDPLWTDLPVSSVGGAAGGAVTLTGTSGVVVGPAAGSDVPIRLGFAGQQAGDLAVASDDETFVRLPLGSADAVLAVNAGGTAPVYTLQPWLGSARFGLGGSAGGNVFGTATVMTAADDSGGEAYGVKASAAAGKGRVAFYKSDETAAGFVGYDEANDRFELGTSGKAWRLSSDAAGAKLPLAGEADNENVGLAGATAFGGMVDGVAFGAGTTAPSSVGATASFRFNSNGNTRDYVGISYSVYVGVTERARFAAAAVGINTNVAVGSVTGSFGGATNAISVANGTAASSNPTNAFVNYAQSGAPLWRTSGGDVLAALKAGSAAAVSFFVANANNGATTTQLKGRLLTLSDGTSFTVLTTDP